MQIYLVGGAVRDKLLNYPVYDRDWVVVGATAEEMLQQDFQPVGQDFPVFIHPESGEEYALARTERKSGKGYCGFQYYASPDVTLTEDLLRRDLTINAMAMDEVGTLYDPYHGQDDLNKKLLRHVSPAFSEDPLRVLRVARFAARYHHLGFTVANETMLLMQELSAGDELEHLTAERIWKEFERALSEPSPFVFLDVLQQCGAIKKAFPELQAYTSSEATMKRFTLLCSNVNKGLHRFACFLSLQQATFDISIFCDRLRSPKTYKELAIQCHKYHEKLAVFDSSSAEDKLDVLLGLDLIRRPQRLDDMQACTEALHLQSTMTQLPAILGLINKIEPQALIKKGFKGAELGKEIHRRRLAICHQGT